MLGLVATVQVLHYPALAETKDIQSSCRKHVRRAGPFIAPPMLLEAISGLALLASPYQGVWLWASLLFLAVVWGSTFAIQVPIHRKLVEGRGESACLLSRLVATNWLRTIAWTARAACLLPILFAATHAPKG